MWQDGLFVWKSKLTHGFPVSHLHPSLHEESPTMSSARPERKPGSRVSASHSLPWALIAARPTWPRAPEQVNPQVKWSECGTGEGVRERGCLFPWVWDGPGAFSEEPINF